GSPPSLAFSKYVEWVRAQIRTARARGGLKGSDEQALLDGQPPSDLDMRSPFELMPTCSDEAATPLPRGVLLIHGLTDSPFLVRDIAESLRRQCLLVRAILLPGHGTVPGDLLEVRYEDWVEAARYGLESFRGQVTDLYLGGFSTGGTLAIYHA